MRTMRVTTLNLATTHPSRDPRYITSREIAKRLGQHHNTIRSSAPAGRYPFQKVLKCGSVAYYDRAEVEEWIDSGARDKFGRYRVTPKAKP